MNKAVAGHVLFWVLYMGIFTFVEGGYSNQFEVAFYMELGFLPFRLVVVYVNYFFLLPRFLQDRQFTNYILKTLLFVIVASFLHRAFMYFYLNDILFPNWNPGGFPRPYKLVQSAMIITSPMIFLIGIEVLLRWLDSERRAEQLAGEKLKAELSYLRSQINPHFFFNTLNNLYGLAMKKSDKTPEVVMMLSELMSYVLYEADKEHVPLTMELEQIERYIRLEQIRYENRFKVEFQTEGDIDHVSIPPLILLPFVENSFKHGINRSSKEGWIAMVVSVSDDSLDFTIRNSIPIRGLEKEEGGLGISNVKKRLELLYDDNQKLEYTEKENEYIVKLTIQRS
ncbi:histidine kinase [Ekhidna sp. MALMAid0563]|uniref:sensor histidine kinase n=1 Tax=Ekhidna sp. MALMAid0563 TaxID=3143937 RepID=UPI0032E005A9